MSDFILLSGFGTILARKDEELVQLPLCEWPHSGMQACSMEYLVAAGLQPMASNHQGIAVQHPSRGFLSTRPDGSLALSPDLNSWESFTPIRPSELKSLIAPRLMSEAIPRIIHQTGNESAPREEFRANVERLRERNPQWTYCYWSEQARHDFIYAEYGWDVLKCYLAISPRYGAARADLFRYLCIYRHGGVYLDIKSNCEPPLDALIRPDDRLLLSQWNMSGSGRHAGWGQADDVAAVEGGEYQQWHIFSCAGHPLLKKVIDQVIGNIRYYRQEVAGVGFVGVLRTTGPYAYTRAIGPSPQLARMFDAETEGLIYSTVPSHSVVAAGRNYRAEQTPVVL